MKEKKIILGLNLIMNLCFLVYINARDKIPNTTIGVFFSCFLISSLILIIILFIERITPKSSSIKKITKLLSIIETTSYFTTFFIFHAINEPIIFSFIIIVLAVLSTYYIKKIYETSNYNLLVSFIKDSKDFVDLDDEELKELRKIRTQLFVIQFINLTLKDIGGNVFKYLIFTVEYLVIGVILIKYFKIIKSFNKDSYKKGMNALVLFMVFHIILVAMLYINLGGILIYAIFSTTTIFMSNFIRDLYEIKESENKEGARKN